MADTIVEANVGGGLGTLTLELFVLDGDDIASTDTATEETNREGLYRWTVTEVLAGAYHARIFDEGGLMVRPGYVYMANDANVHRFEESFAMMMLQEEWKDGGRLDVLLDAVTGGAAVNITTDTTIVESG